jgi:excisionase family DNA binding protein
LGREYEVYAAIRRYRVDTDSCSEVVKLILERFVPLIKESQGLLAYYVLDAGDGVIATMTICEDKEKVEESSRVATEWLKQYLASSIVRTEELHGFAFEVDDPLQGPLYEGVSGMDTDGQSKRLLSVQEVCQELGMGKSWVYQQIRDGELPSIQLGGSVKVERTDLEEYLSERRRRAAQE